MAAYPVMAYSSYPTHRTSYIRDLGFSEALKPLRKVTSTWRVRSRFSKMLGIQGCQKFRASSMIITSSYSRWEPPTRVRYRLDVVAYWVSSNEQLLFHSQKRSFYHVFYS